MLLQPYEDPPAAASSGASASSASSSSAYVEWHRRCGASRPEPEQARRRPAQPVSVAAGTIVAMAPYVWHCSDANRTGAVRRAYMPQYSAGPVLTASDAGADHESRVPLALAAPV